jgi:hypothetical protein
MTAIVQLPNPCWALTDTAGGPHYLTNSDGDLCDPHLTQNEAETLAATETTRTGTPVRAAPLDRPCWTAVAACGRRYGDDDSYLTPEHTWDRESLELDLADDGWITLPDGRMTCGPRHCDTCTGLHARAALTA